MVESQNLVRLPTSVAIALTKKADSRNQSGRAKSWLKAKPWDIDEFTLIGFEINSEGNPIPLLAREHADPSTPLPAPVRTAPRNRLAATRIDLPLEATSRANPGSRPVNSHSRGGSCRNSEIAGAR